MSSADIVGCGVYTLGRCDGGINQYRVSGMPFTVGTSLASCSHLAKSSVPGNGVSITNCANDTPLCCARSAVAANVPALSVGNPKMNEPSTCTPLSRNA